DENSVHDRIGLAAVVREGAVFSARCGCYLGQFDSGFFRDMCGCIVAFVEGAHGGAVLPGMKSVGCPVPAARGVPALPAAGNAGAEPARSLLNWSALDWASFLAGHPACWPWEVGPRGSTAADEKASAFTGPERSATDV
ncbi:MAG: hypothetical protein JO250_04765, partial [Armatimonadetes bacterium]|nr:hypothetical protein [Armatimonadota bacterium]